MARVTELLVNGVRRSLDVDGDLDLLGVLRDDLGLTGSKYGCGEGQCGACTVLLNGRAVRSCVTKVSAVAGRPVITIEGLETGGRLHPVQQAFLDTDAMQCGYCTAGMIMSGVSLLAQNPNPGPDEIRRGMEGNICRCGTHPRIVQAIQTAARNGGAR